MSYFNDPYHRFFFFIGNTDDDFCPSAPGVFFLEEILHQHLSELGYPRQIFYDGRRKIYFHDSESKRLSRPDTDRTQPSPSSEPRKQRTSGMCAGPLGHRRIRRGSSENNRLEQNSPASGSVPGNERESLLFSRMPDSQVPGTLDRLMKEESPKTAVIFKDGLDFITHLDNNTHRLMKSALQEWGNLPSVNHNLCIFILHGTDIGRLRQKMERHEWDFLLNKFFVRENIPSAQVISIASPRQDEIANLLHYWRLKKGMSVDWSGFSENVARLARHCCASGGTLKSLSYKIQQYNDLKQDSMNELLGQSEQSPAWERLRNMHGLNIVIEKLERLIARHREAMEQNPKTESRQRSGIVSRLLPPVRRVGESLNLHLALKGNPGTGKTTVARLIAEIYRDMGLLETGHMVKASREDLVAGYVGQTAIQTAQKVAEAMGGVLFVDEAYRLSEGGESDFGQEAIETIMEAMSNNKGDFAVIVAGYPERIESFLDANPGLRRRFGETNTLTIPDYEPETLRNIFEQYAEKQGRHIHSDLKERLPDFFANWYSQRNPETFGNAGEVVDNLYPAMEESRIMRVRNESDATVRFTLTSEDIPELMRNHLRQVQPSRPDEVMEKLDGLIGLSGVKKQVRNLINAIKVRQLRGDQGQIFPGHYLFTGNPGTGKTTVARLMGEIFQGLGILKKGHLVETGRSDLVAGYSGQTALKTREVLDKSLDGVLFIDEAYQLLQSDRDEFGKEAVETLVAYMENCRDRLCIIAAGYPKLMHKFMNSNPGLPSRFAGTIHFENYLADEMMRIFRLRANERKLTFGQGVEEKLNEIFRIWEQEKSETFGNGREVRKLLDAVCTRQNNRLIEQGITDRELLFRVEVCDIL